MAFEVFVRKLGFHVKLPKIIMFYFHVKLPIQKTEKQHLNVDGFLPVYMFLNKFLEGFGQSY